MVALKNFKKKLKRLLFPEPKLDISTVVSIERKKEGTLKVLKEITEKTKHSHSLSPYEEIQEFSSKPEFIENYKRIQENSSMTDEEKKLKLEEIGASSEWAAYYDLQAFPPRESFRDNEELFLNVPYLKSGLILRADMSVGVGIKDIKDEETEDETDQEKFIKREFDRLDIEKKLHKTSMYVDLFGNAYWYKEWYQDAYNGKKRMKTVSVLHPARVRIRLNKFNSLEKIGYAYLPPILVPGNYLQPEPITLTEMIQFKGEEYDDLPYGYSLLRALLTVLQARWDINVIEPIIYRHAAKPWIQFKLKSAGLSDAEIRQYMNDLETVLKASGPESDLITLDLWEASSFSGGQASNGNIVKSLTDDVDNQIFGVLKIPETYFKPKGTTDRMILKQDDNFSKEMKRRQNYFGWLIREELIVPMLEAEFGARVKVQTLDGTEKYNYEIPSIVWNDVLEINEFERNNDIRENLKVGILNVDEARKDMNLPEREQPQETLPVNLDQGLNAPINVPQDQPVVMPSTPLPESSVKRKEVLQEGNVRLTIEEV